MTIHLPGNFFGNARGISIVDSASVTWSFNKNTNELSAGAGVGPPAGITAVITTAKLTGGGANGSMTFTNGVLTAHSDAT